MRYIYCFENLINGHKYVGQTNNLVVRYSAHKSQAYNPNSKDYNCLFHKKIRQYGLENFKFYTLEEISNEDPDYVDFRESFWIQELNTWCRYGQGYNQNTGGSQFKKNLLLSDDDAKQIKKLLKETDISFADLAKQFNTYRECIARINSGRYFFEESRTYPIRATRDWREIPQEIKVEIAVLLRDTKMPMKEIAKKFSISEHTVHNINKGISNLEGDFIYPLRKTNSHLTKEVEDEIYRLLLKGEGDTEIAKKINVHASTVNKRRKKYNL